MTRVFRTVHLHYRLASFEGVSPTTLERRWYFELPAARDTPEAWNELLHRLFYDQNVMAQRAEPYDQNWLALDSFEVTPLDARHTLGWPGISDQEHAGRFLPWHAELTVTAACSWIDDDGRYDPIEAEDFSELIGLRLFAAGEVDEKQFLRLLDGLHPGQGARYFAARAARLASIASVLPSAAFHFHKAPDEPPIASGPPTKAHVDPDSSSSAAPITTVAPKSAPAPQPGTEESDDAPPRSSRFLHPGTISIILVLVILATCAISNVRDRVQRSALEQALAPLQKEWSALREQAGPRMASIEALLGASEPREHNCASLTGAISVIHRPMLGALAAGTPAPRPGPLWLNSDAWLYLALALTPGRDVDAYRRRNEVVREAIAQSCVGILDVEQAASARAVDAHQFEGGEVSGRLRIVCIDNTRIACDVPIMSRPNFAVSVVQRDGRAQASADATAVDDAAARAYWQAIEVALAEHAPGLRVERVPSAP